MKAKLQWVVAPGDGERLSDILAQMRAAGATTAGRVFVNGRPANDEDRMSPGDVLEVWPVRPTPADDEVRIVAQRDGVLVVYKPAGLPTETTQLGQNSVKSALLTRLAGGPLHAASRLDTQVSGLLTFTLGRDANRRVHQWRQQGQLRRSYIAIAQGVCPPQQGQWSWPLAKRRDRGGRHRMAHDSRGKAAVTHYTELASIGERACLLQLRPQTGRQHQLRAHAQLAGVPFFGDRRYGGDGDVCDGDGRVQLLPHIALHAIALELPAMDCYAPPPQWLKQLWQHLGGEDEAWGRTDPRGSRPKED